MYIEKYEKTIKIKVIGMIIKEFYLIIRIFRE